MRALAFASALDGADQARDTREEMEQASLRGVDDDLPVVELRRRAEWVRQNCARRAAAEEDEAQERLAARRRREAFTGHATAACCTLLLTFSRGRNGLGGAEAVLTPRAASVLSVLLWIVDWRTGEAVASIRRLMNVCHYRSDRSVTNALGELARAGLIERLPDAMRVRVRLTFRTRAELLGRLTSLLPRSSCSGIAGDHLLGSIPDPGALSARAGVSPDLPKSPDLEGDLNRGQGRPRAPTARAVRPPAARVRTPPAAAGAPTAPAVRPPAARVRTPPPAAGDGGRRGGESTTHAGSRRASGTPAAREGARGAPLPHLGIAGYAPHLASLLAQLEAIPRATAPPDDDAERTRGGRA